jgi:hypothetical protein
VKLFDVADAEHVVSVALIEDDGEDEDSGSEASASDAAPASE